MTSSKRWLIATTIGLAEGIVGGIVSVVIVSIFYLFEGGIDAVVRLWNYDQAESSDSWKWVGLLSIPLAAWSGLFVWRWFMLRTGLLTKEEMDEAWGTNQNDRS